MYLARLDIQGFKSFAQKTQVNFNKGITGIVGPNGCGKTNIVDALRWCLGEQKSSVLRSDKMENVIFNGTAKKKPMGMAEVSLTIVNDKGILPTEYSEVIITRRVFRSGESEYLLNKNVARLKDITNLFMDTGMGTGAYSVIELKMVESILSARHEDRRFLFEEAAGVNKYKLRRKMTVKKLEDVKADLSRVNDIIVEVEKKVNSLEKQAKKAEKYKLLSEKLKTLELEYAQREFNSLSARLEHLTATLNGLNERKKDLTLTIQDFENSITVIRQDLVEVEEDLKAKRKESQDALEQIHKHQRAISVAEETLRSLNRNIEKYRLELDELSEQILINEDIIVEHQDKVQSTTIRIQKLEEEKVSLEISVKEWRAKLDELRAVVRTNSAENLNKFKELTVKQNDLSNLRNSISSKEYQISKKEERIEKIKQEIEKCDSLIDSYNSEYEILSAELLEAEKELESKEILKNKLEEEITALKSSELDAKVSYGELKNKINFLKNLIENLEGFSKGTKVLFESKMWEGKDKTLLANIGEATEEYKFAIESALKNNLNNILLKSFDDVNEAIDYLRQENAGKASFLIYGGLSGDEKTFSKKIIDFLNSRKSKKLEKEPGVIGWAINLIQTETKWLPFFEKILQSTVVVKDLDSGLPLREKYPHITFVTLDGDVIYPTGVLEAGARPVPDETLFGRKQLLEKQEKELEVKEEELIQLSEQIEDKNFQLAEIDLKIFADKIRTLNNSISAIDKLISQNEYEKSKNSKDLEFAIDEIEELKKRLQEDRDVLSERESTVTVLSADKTAADDSLRQLEADIRNSENEHSALTQKLRSVELEHTKAIAERTNIENSIRNCKDTIENVKRSILRREQDIFTAEGEIKYLDEKLEDDRFDLQELRDKKSVLSEKEAEVEVRFNDIRTKIMQIEDESSTYRKEKDLVSNESHKLELEANEIEINKRNLCQKIEERYSVMLEFVDIELDENYNFSGAKLEIRQLEQQVQNLGLVNALAAEEYDEEKGRFDFLMSQRNDLLESEQDLVRTMNEINTTAQNLFNDTFEKIRTNFISIFQKLFNQGDECDLRLEEGVDPLESKIEIVAKPKGKRPTSIELLSGGEKTLTAIALLFAIYLVKPSPFCILDEIDAPLDDANIDRFTNILREFSVNTQFIVVTHNKRTMEAAEVMYGVTMQEEGVSKLVGVRFDENANYIAN